MRKCTRMAHVKNSKGEVVVSRLYEDLLTYTSNNRRLTKEYYAVGTNQEFLDKVRDRVEFDENGEIAQLAGSYFWWDISDGIPRYGKEWSDTLTFYLEKCYLLLSTQDGEIRTEKVCEADRYNYANFCKDWKEAYEEWNVLWLCSRNFYRYDSLQLW